MIEWQQEYFQKFSYARNQILKYLSSARKDLSIAKKAKIDEVRFQFAYNAFLKLGISLMACYGFKVRSRAGHHIKILEQTALILNDENITAYGNQMRKTRNSLGLSMDGTAWQAGATTGDVDCSGTSNSTDALLILRYSLGLSMEETGWCE